LLNKTATFSFRLLTACVWLLLIYLFLPFTPAIFKFLSAQIGSAAIRSLLISLTIASAASAYIPFIQKFGRSQTYVYFIITLILAVASAINISIKIPAQMLHIPEYLILTIFLYRAFILKNKYIKSCILAGTISVIACIIDERVIQYSLPVRVYDFNDILLNAAGAIFGVLLLMAYNISKK